MPGQAGGPPKQSVAEQQSIASSNATVTSFLGARSQKSWMSGAGNPSQPPSRPAKRRQPSLHAVQQQFSQSVLPSPAPSDEPSPAVSNAHDSPNPVPAALPGAQIMANQPLGLPVSEARFVYDSALEVIGPRTHASPPMAAMNPPCLTVGSTPVLQTNSPIAPPDPRIPSTYAVPPVVQSPGIQRSFSQSPATQSPVAQSPGYLGSPRQPQAPEIGAPLPKRRRTEDVNAQMIQALDRHIERRGGEQALIVEVEKPRIQLIRDACMKDDIFFLALHQLFCLWSESPQRVQPFLKQDARVVNHAFSILETVLKQNQLVPTPTRVFFQAFPGDISKIITSTKYGLAVSQVSVFLGKLVASFQPLTAHLLKRQYPYLVEELAEGLGCRSPILQLIFFTACRRRLGVVDGPLGAQMEQLFRQDQNKPPGGGSDQEKAALIHEYKEIVAKAGNTASPAQVAVSTTGSSASQPPAPTNVPHSPQVAPSLEPRGHNSLVSSQTPSQAPEQSHLAAPLGAQMPTLVYPAQVPAVSQFGVGQPQSPQNRPYPLATHPQYMARQSQVHQRQVQQQQVQQQQAQQQQVQQQQAQQQQVQQQQVQQQHAMQQFQQQFQQRLRQPHQPQQVQQQLVAQQLRLIQHTQHTQHAQHMRNVQPFAQASQRQSIHFVPVPGNSPVQLPGSVAQTQQQSMAPLRSQYAMSPLRTSAPGQPPALSVVSPLINGTFGHPMHAAAPGFLPSQYHQTAQPGLEQGADGYLLPHRGETISRPYWPVDAQDRRSVMMSLHQALSRSPKRSVRSDQPERFYQALKSLLAGPMMLTPKDALQTLHFTVTREQYERCTTTSRSEGNLLPVAEHFNGSLRWRLRACKPYGSGPVTEHEWVVLETDWPTTISIDCNKQALEIRRPGHHGKDQPIELTNFIVCGTNTITISYMEHSSREIGGPRLIAVELLETLSHSSIMDLVWQQGVIPEEHTLQTIKHRLSRSTDDDGVISEENLAIELADPFSQTILKVPVRGATCTHLDCFDLETWLETRPSRRPASCQHALHLPCSCPKSEEPSDPDKWRCPRCLGDARPYNLRIDGFLLKVRQQLEKEGKLDTKSMHVEADGSWEVVVEEDDPPDSDDEAPVRAKRATSAAARKQEVEVIELDSD